MNGTSTRSVAGRLLLVAAILTGVWWSLRSPVEGADGSPDVVSRPESPAVGRRSDEFAGTPSSDVPRTLASSQVTVRVETTSGKPLPGAAAVLVESLGATRELGTTGETGRLGIERGLVTPDTALEVHADGFVSVHLESGEAWRSFESDAELVVTLERSLVVRGHVRWGDGHPEEGAMVVAWSVRPPPSRATLALAIERGVGDAPSVLVGWTEPDGRFELEGARTGTRYLVTAGAPGVLTPVVATGSAASGQASVELRAYGHYALLLLLVDELGAPLDRPAVTFGSEYITRIPDGVVPMAPTNVVQRLLAGISREGWEPAESGVLLEYVSDRDVPFLGPVKHRACHPGHQAEDTDLRIPRSRDGLETVSIVLRRADSATGRVFVDVVGWHDPDPVSFDSRYDAATLVLIDTDTGQATECVVRQPSESPIVVEGVPHGEYRLWLTMAGGLEHLRPVGTSTIEVGPVDPTVVFDLRDSGRLEIELSDEVARLVPGRAMFHVGSTEEGGLGGWFAFQTPPYVIDAVRPGRYAVVLYALREPGESGVRVETTEVRAGETTRVRLSESSARDAPFEIRGLTR